MNLTIHPKSLKGEVTVIPSKSQAHRLLICAAFADGPTELICPDTNRDIQATVDCLNALGAEITYTQGRYLVTPVISLPSSATLNCWESGSTLRFLLPIAGALGVDATFQMAGRLPQRPLSPLWEELERMGCRLIRPTFDTLRIEGALRPGHYSIDGSVSSQYITGLMLALSLMNAPCSLQVTGKIESTPYIRLTEQALRRFSVSPKQLGGQPLRSPGKITVEGDWSNGAFFHAAKALGSQLTISGLNPESSQGDREIATLIPLFQRESPTICVRDIPDLVPILSVLAAAHNGACFTNIHRLRLKESDRVQSTINMIQNLGGSAMTAGDTLVIHPHPLTGGTVDAVNDHRIAMSAAIAATVCSGDVTILGSECVKKSYPRFWEEYERLGGHYEQYLR